MRPGCRSAIWKSWRSWKTRTSGQVDEKETRANQGWPPVGRHTACEVDDRTRSCRAGNDVRCCRVREAGRGTERRAHPDDKVSLPITSRMEKPVIPTGASRSEAQWRDLF